ncbi:hypothetical protein OAN59_10765 [Alphaproteobacteria bacterium]|nr:hypothetical protein [Alphaproteobacteria bacterium]
MVKKVKKLKRGLGDLWVGRRLSLNPKDKNMKLRIGFAAAAILALPVTAMFVQTSPSEAESNSLPVVKAEAGPRVVTAKGEPIIVGLKNTGTFGPWTTFIDGRSSQKICYMTTNAVNTGSKKRVLRIEHAPSWDWFNQVKYQHGESLDDFMRVALQIIPKKAEILAVNDQNAWMEEERQHRFFKKIKAEATKTIDILLGTHTRVKFDISDFNAALAVIDSHCNTPKEAILARGGKVQQRTILAKAEKKNDCLPYEVAYGSKCFFNHDEKEKWEIKQQLNQQPDWKAAALDENAEIFYAKVEGNITKTDWLGVINSIKDCSIGSLIFTVHTNKVDNLDKLIGKKLHVGWNGDTIEVKVGSTKKFPKSSSVTAMMLVTEQSIANILKVHKDDKTIRMKLQDTDEIVISDYFDKPINLWSVIGMQDAAAKAMGLCALNTKEAKLENKTPKEKVKKDESLDMVSL